MKIIFLDIDGVLNSDVYMKTDAYKEETKQAGCFSHKGYEVVLKAHHTHLDPAAILLLNQLVAKSGARVVLSSTWRLKYSLDKMNEMLKSRGATFEITDQTPQIAFSYVLRGREIREYLEELEEQPETFVILDDINEFPTFKKEFVYTPEKTGLTQAHVDCALKILNGE